MFSLTWLEFLDRHFAGLGLLVFLVVLVVMLSLIDIVAAYKGR